MAWLKCQNASPVPPIPTGTFTNDVTRSAPISGYHESHPKSVTLDTRNVASMTVNVSYFVRADANGSSGSWESYAESIASFTFKVDGVTKLSTGNIRAYSNNQGEQRTTGSASYNLTDLPRGNCVFDYDVWIESFYQNGEQLDTFGEACISFSFSNIVYK